MNKIGPSITAVRLVGRLTRMVAAAAVATGLSTAVAGHAAAAGGEVELPHQSWSFSGVFGHFDDKQLQRGFQVYQQVCSACHAVDYLYYRDLLDLGYSEDHVKGIAAAATVPGDLDEFGEPTERPAIPADRFAKPFPNDVAAAASNGGAVPPDLSLLSKARAGGADHIYGVLVGYRDEVPADKADEISLTATQYYNEYYPGHVISMAPPLFEGAVEYQDGTPATVEQMAKDVSAFLTWAAEPTMEERKRTGIKVILFLIVMTAVFYAVKRKIWSDVH